MSKPKAIITTLSPNELFAAALHNARHASDQIDELMASQLDSNETPMDRAVKVCAHAVRLSEAFAIIDSLADIAAEDPAPHTELEPEPTTTNPLAN